MAKRFTDTEKWRDEWWGSLSNDYRMIWLYLIDSCSIAGIWKKDFRGMNFNCNTNVTESDFILVFKDRLVDRGNFFFIPKFIRFQYPKGLNSNKPAIISVVRELKENGLLGTIKELFGNDYLIIKDKDKDKDRTKTRKNSPPKSKPDTPAKDESFNAEIAKILHKPYHKGKERGMDAKGQDVDSLVLTLQKEGWSNNKIRDQATAMRAVYAKEKWSFPSNYITLLTAIQETDWIDRMKSEDPERKAEIISQANGKHYTPQFDEIGTSAPGSLG